MHDIPYNDNMNGKYAFGFGIRENYTEICKQMVNNHPSILTNRVAIIFTQQSPKTGKCLYETGEFSEYILNGNYVLEVNVACE